jgi:hypothetical protein
MEPIKISRDGVYKLIKNINPSKATGPDTIAGRVLKENIDICTDIQSISFCTAVFCVVPCRKLLRSPLLSNLFVYFCHCFVIKHDWSQYLYSMTGVNIYTA